MSEQNKRVAEGDFVFFLGHVSGTLEGDLPGLPASVKRLDPDPRRSAARDID